MVLTSIVDINVNSWRQLLTSLIYELSVYWHWCQQLTSTIDIDINSWRQLLTLMLLTLLSTIDVNCWRWCQQLTSTVDINVNNWRQLYVNCWHLCQQLKSTVDICDLKALCSLILIPQYFVTACWYHLLLPPEEENDWEIAKVVHNYAGFLCHLLPPWVWRLDEMQRQGQV